MRIRLLAQRESQPSASAYAKGKLSLNDCLYTGLNINLALLGLLIKFRKFSIDITGNIHQMIVQIKIDD